MAQRIDEIEDDVRPPPPGRGGFCATVANGQRSTVRFRAREPRAREHEAGAFAHGPALRHRGERDARHPWAVVRVSQLDHHGLLPRLEAVARGIAVRRLDAHLERAGGLAARREPVDDERASRRQPDVEVEPCAERQVEQVLRRPRLARGLGADEAQRLPGNAEPAVVGVGAAGRLARRARPGIAEDEPIVAGRERRGRDLDAPLGAGAGDHDLADLLAVGAHGHHLLRRAGVRVRPAAQAQQQVARRGEEEVDLGLRPVAPDERVLPLPLVDRPAAAEKLPRRRRAEVDPPRLTPHPRRRQAGGQVGERREVRRLRPAGGERQRGEQHGERTDRRWKETARVHGGGGWSIATAPQPLTGACRP